MRIACPRIVVAGTGSGVGKTSLVMGLTLAFLRRGLKVRTFKVGPDFLDPSYLALASGYPCYNLDGWMSSRDYVLHRFADVTGGADLAIVEGVMGMHDGASPNSAEGSTAEIAEWLQAPVLLVASAHGVARSFAAMVKGFASMDAQARIEAVVANNVGSDTHVQWLRESLRSLSLPPLLGALPKACFPALKSRHLGLATADYAATINQEDQQSFAEACEQHLDLDAVLSVARQAEPLTCNTSRRCPQALPSGIRIAVAKDAAFHFYYPDNIELLQELGAEVVKFSPLADAGLPDNIDAVYLGGGYPELFAQTLSSNEPMRCAIRQFADRGGAVYAECGGLMYLSDRLECGPDKSYPMTGILPVTVRMLPRVKRLGYAEVILSSESAWGPLGTRIRGHEFHYSEIMNPEALTAAGWHSDYAVQYRRHKGSAREGFRKHRILASYLHLHFASQPEAALHFLRWCAPAQATEVHG